MPRIKVTGFIDPDDYGADPEHPTGLTAEGYDRLHEDFLYKMEEVDVTKEDSE
jgi:hypothetical protein